VLAVSLLAIIPALPMAIFGMVSLSVTGAWAVWVLIRLWRTAAASRAPGERVQRIRRQLPSLIGFGILVVSAARMALGLGDDGDRGWLCGGVITLLLSATAVSWNLLLRVGKAERSEGK
jgi:hypothetical protein